MKKVLILLAAILIILLSACSAAAAATEAADTVGTDERAQTLSRLILLTFTLEDTDQAVTPAQAQDLLPLWKAARAINNSDNAADQELDAVYRQIAETMTAGQLSMMNDGDIDMQAFSQIMQQYGVSARSQSDSSDNTTGFSPGAGGGFGGGPGAGGGIPGGGAPPADFAGGASPDAAGAQTTGTAGGRQGAGSGAAQFLLDPLIELLKARAAE